MGFTSIVREVANISLPAFQGDQLYMQPVDLATRRLPRAFSRWNDTVAAMIEEVPLREGIVYLTIDEKEVKAQQSLRRGGAHIDGLWNPALQMHGDRGHIMPASERKEGEWYFGQGGGLMLLSNIEGCRAWTGEFEAIPGVGGDLEHIRGDLDAAPSFIMAAEKAYLCNVWGIHESLPMTETTQRSLVRLTLPEEVIVQ